MNPQQHNDWLEWRQGGIGSSDSPVIMKQFPYGKTPLMLYNEKKNGPFHKTSKAMQHGKDNEDAALDWFEKKMSCKLFRQLRVEDEEHSWFRATLDGVDLEKEICVEVKCFYNPEKHEEIKKTKEIPDIFYTQMQHQERINQYGKIYFLSYSADKPNDSVIIEVPRDESYISKIASECEMFWECFKAGIPPDATELDLKLKRMEDNQQWKLHAPQLLRTREKIKLLQQQEDELRELLVSAAEGESAMGFGLSLVKSETQGAVDYKNAVAGFVKDLKEKHPNLDIPELNFEGYRKKPFTKWTARSIHNE